MRSLVCFVGALSELIGKLNGSFCVLEICVELLQHISSFRSLSLILPVMWYLRLEIDDLKESRLVVGSNDMWRQTVWWSCP